MDLFLLVLLWIPMHVVIAFYTGFGAEAKGHRLWPWFWGGLLFGWIALLAMVGLPLKSQYEGPPAPRATED
ncbi:hypothetical protein [Candidatus Palauibacter sp.]|uniref:hypothetical protein n=1 Tax=Candidatus Palauibacter sp. TaxID=3101350 RepID=UPI003AF29B54